MRQAIIAEANSNIINMYFDADGALVYEGLEKLTCAVMADVAHAHTSNLPTYCAEIFTEELLKEYREFSSARECRSGFSNFYTTCSIELQRHRQEMLYYFWLANQEM